MPIAGMLYCYKTAPNVVAIGACERTECDIKYEIVDYMPVADPEQALRATWLHFAADQVHGGYSTSPEALCSYFNTLRVVQLTPIEELAQWRYTTTIESLTMALNNSFI